MPLLLVGLTACNKHSLGINKKDLRLSLKASCKPNDWGSKNGAAFLYTIIEVEGDDTKEFDQKNNETERKKFEIYTIKEECHDDI
ncbi:hypothetical protein [Cardinium endosymbiont of Culicoides punctatus]|uniref:hypothetical protein n=1 Tax=Cardinium endosymbiont of Culicoides punctatus TaxID=2304601 RepID=UPI00195A7AF2|nr:hypothetical protein [Cardinium endosymbiont of Culicoides punctatus]